MKRKICRNYERSTMLYGREKWCLRKNEVAILRTADISIMKVMCGVKLMDKRNTEDLMEMLGWKEAADKLARAIRMSLYNHVLRRPEEDALMKAMVYKVDGKHKQGRPKMKRREQVEENMRRIGLKKENAAYRCRWRESVRRVAEVVGCIRPTPVTGD